MKTYRIKVRYVFEGWFEIVAETKQEACGIAERDCGFVIGGDIHTSNDRHVMDWEFDVHPDKHIVS